MPMFGKALKLDFFKVVLALTVLMYFGFDGISWAQENSAPEEVQPVLTINASDRNSDNVSAVGGLTIAGRSFLRDPEAFIEGRTPDEIASVVERLIADNPGAIGIVADALVQLANTPAESAIADGIARAVGRLAAEGRDEARARILARVAGRVEAAVFNSIAESAVQYTQEAETAGIGTEGDQISAPEIVSPEVQLPPSVGTGDDGGANDGGVQALAPITNAPGVDDGRDVQIEAPEESIIGLSEFGSPRDESISPVY